MTYGTAVIPKAVKPHYTIRHGLWELTELTGGLAIENELQRPFRTVRAHFELRSTHLSCRATWMLLDGPPSWRQRNRPQPIDEAEDFSEQLPRHRHFGHLKRDIRTVPHDFD